MSVESLKNQNKGPYTSWRITTLKNLIKKHAEKIRFGLVGVVNTAIDFGILLALVRVFGLPTIGANYISTSFALIFSFFANKKFTFKNNDKTQVKQFIVFLSITLVGLWIIQPLVISGIELMIADFIINSSFKLIIAKLLATVASLIWNYLMYRKFVFTK